MDQEMLQRWLEAHDIDIMRVARKPGIRLVMSGNAPFQVYFEYEYFKLDAGGRRFLDMTTQEAAIEVRMTPVVHLPS